MMLRFRLLQSDSETLAAEGLELSDGRVVVVAARVSMMAKLYRNREEMRADWRSAVIEWVDVPEESA